MHRGRNASWVIIRYHWNWESAPNPAKHDPNSEALLGRAVLRNRHRQLLEPYVLEHLATQS